MITATMCQAGTSHWFRTQPPHSEALLSRALRPLVFADMQYQVQLDGGSASPIMMKADTPRLLNH